ncbi:MAG: hypothetical protein IJ085_02660, partial [Turicibacter sp.]|nr:hypothetical protein [Turicibacter sp.]
MNDLNEEKITKSNHLATKRALRSLIAILISLTLLVIIYFLIYFNQSPSQITFVKNQILETYETQTIGTALDNFFYHPTWNSSTKNSITCTGEAYWGEEEEEEAIFTLQFFADIEKSIFDITSYTINDETQTY